MPLAIVRHRLSSGLNWSFARSFRYGTCSGSSLMSRALSITTPLTPRQCVSAWIQQPVDPPAAGEPNPESSPRKRSAATLRRRVLDGLFTRPLSAGHTTLLLPPPPLAAPSPYRAETGCGRGRRLV